MRIIILTENLTIHIYTYDHSHLVCNRIPTSIIYSLTEPDTCIRALTFRKNFRTTSSMGSGSSTVVALRSRISGAPPPPPEHASCLTMIQVHSHGIPDDLPGPLPRLPLTLRLQRQQSNALQVDAGIPRLVTRQLLSLSSLNGVTTAAATMCTKYLTDRITYLSRPVGTV